MDDIDNVKNNEVVRCLEADAFQLHQDSQKDLIRHELDLEYLREQVDQKNDWIVELGREISALKAIIAEQNKVIAEKDEALARIGAEYEAKYKSMIDAQV